MCMLCHSVTSVMSESFATLWTMAHQAPLSMGFSGQEYWGGLPCPPPGDIPNPGTEPVSLMSPALAVTFFTTSVMCVCVCVCVLVAQSCPTLCNPMDCSLPGSFVHGILQARILEWVAISFAHICVCICIHTHTYTHTGASLVAQMVKNPPAMPVTWVWSLGWEDPLEEGMAAHSSIFAQRIPCTGEPGGLQSILSQRVGHYWSNLACTRAHTHTQLYSWMGDRCIGNKLVGVGTLTYFFGGKRCYSVIIK